MTKKLFRQIHKPDANIMVLNDARGFTVVLGLEIVTLDFQTSFQYIIDRR